MKIKLNILLFIMIIVQNLDAMNKNDDFEIRSFHMFSKKYLKRVKTYPEVVDEVCSDGNQDLDKIYEYNVRTTYQAQKPIIAKHELLKAINQVAEKVGDSVSTSAWVDGNPLPKQFFTQQVPAEKIDLRNSEHTKLFAAFEKKLFLDDTKGEEIKFFGDLHGGCKSLIKSLERYIDKNSFSIKTDKKNVHLAFLGDFVDSGKDGVEVLYLLARIWAANPENVHIIRGNHEDAKFNLQQSFYHELAYKYGTINSDPHVFGLYDKYQLEPELYNAITRFYDFMPLALFVGNRRYTFFGKDWRLACHGGFEVGDVNIQNLLAYPAKVAYKFVGERIATDEYQSIIKRRTVFEDINKKYKLAIECQPDEFTDFSQTYVDFIPLSPGAGKTANKEGTFSADNNNLTTGCTNGYCWSLFHEDASDYDLSYSRGMNAWKFGQKLSTILLQRPSTYKNQLVGMIRAHQHTSTPDEYTKYPLMEHLLRCKGSWTFWQDKQKQNPASHGAITTLIAAPDTYYGVAKKSTKETEKHFPGIAKYAYLTMKPQKGWFWVTLKTQTNEIHDILPLKYEIKHHQLMLENIEKDSQNRKKTKNGLCNIL